jgi:hypothetical protein
VRFDSSTCTRLTVDMVLNVNPVDTTLELWLDDQWHPCEWTGPGVFRSGRYYRPARTVDYFKGPNAEATVPDPYVLGEKRYRAKTRLTTAGGDAIVETSDYIDVG